MNTPLIEVRIECRVATIEAGDTIEALKVKIIRQLEPLKMSEG